MNNAFLPANMVCHGKKLDLEVGRMTTIMVMMF
jgi:hypothetical protein